MGEPLPPEPPEIDIEKWYCVIIDAFQDMTPLAGCTQTYIGRFHCCEVGELIQAWIDNNFECTDGPELCIVTGFTAQRIIDINGPYDNEPECWLNCPPP